MNEQQHIEAWAREAGAIAMRAFHDIHAAPPRRKSDRSWVTDVDEDIETLLRERIAAVYPDDQVMGEEGGGLATTKGRVWVLDPIDGTGSFVKRLPVWGVSIGLMVDGRTAAGCMYLPVSDECYLAGLDGPPLLNGLPIDAHVAEPLDSQAWICVPSNTHRRYRIEYPGKTRSLGSTAANICYVARGGAAAALLGRSSLWDLVGALAVLERAGGVLGTLSGAPIDWQPLLRGECASEPLFAASAANYELIRTLIVPL
jgi:myo-inositol-1(or 4)-monophosphatase